MLTDLLYYCRYALPVTAAFNTALSPIAIFQKLFSGYLLPVLQGLS